MLRSPRRFARAADAEEGEEGEGEHLVAAMDRLREALNPGEVT
jgi:hypothetical protein